MPKNSEAKKGKYFLPASFMDGNLFHASMTLRNCKAKKRRSSNETNADNANALKNITKLTS